MGVTSVYNTESIRHFESSEPGRTERVCRLHVRHALEELIETGSLWPGIRNLQTAISAAGMLAGLENEPIHLLDAKLKAYLASVVKTLADALELPYPPWTNEPSLVLKEPWFVGDDSFKLKKEMFQRLAKQNSPKHFREHNIFIDDPYGVSGITIETIRRKKEETRLYNSYLNKP